MPAQSVFKLNFFQIQSMIYAVNCLDFCLVLLFLYAEQLLHMACGVKFFLLHHTSFCYNMCVSYNTPNVSLK
jgi:hypothetical protein